MLFLWGDMMKVKLGDVCEIVSGTTPKSNCPEYWNGELNWITPAELNDDIVVVNESQRKITTKAVIDSNLRSFPAGTVLLSSRAPIGKVAIAGKEMYCNQGFKNLICSDFVYNKYLFYFLKSKVTYLNSLGRGATFKEISKTIVENIQINLPKKEEQYKIVHILDKINEIIFLRQQQLKKLDELVKSRFIEMFGDTVLNPYNWKKDLLGMVCDVRDGTHDSPQYYEIGYPLVTSKNVTAGIIDLSDCSLISEEDYNKINERSKVDIGDIIMPMIGTVGKPVIVNVEPNFAIKNVSLIKFKKESKVLNIYIRAFLQSDYFDDAVLSKLRGGTQKFISLGDIRNLEVLMPPIELQNEFADFVKQTDKSKLEIKKSLDKLEILKKSLMQQYFE